MPKLVWPVCLMLVMSGCGQVPQMQITTTSTTKTIANWNATVTFPPRVTFIPNPERTNAVGTAGGEAVAYFDEPFIYEYGILEQATLSVITDCTRLQALDNPVVATPPQLLPATTTLAGRVFTLQSYGASSARHHANAYVYVLRESERCLGLALSTFSVNQDFLEPPHAKSFDEAGLENIFLDFIHSLVFN